MPSFTYWTVADGQHAKMATTMIASARKVGVTEDFHVWTDVQEIPGAICHPCGVYKKDLYLFKLEFLKNEVQKLDYDYLVFLDADNYFVRHPGDVLKLTHGGKVFIQMENDITSPKVKRPDWWSAPIKDLIKLMEDMGCEKGSKLYNTNAGFWIVRRDAVNEFYDMAMDYWREGQRLGYKNFTEEPPLAFCGHIMADPEKMTLVRTSHVWASDWIGNFKDRLPNGNQWRFEDYMSGEPFFVNPAIVHAMRSKTAMINKVDVKEPIEVERKPQDKLPVLMVAYGDYPDITLGSINKIINLSEAPSRLRFMVGMNECGAKTKQELRRLHDEGKIEVLVESSINRNKDPLMRVLIDLVDEEYFVWFDDDSYPSEKGWDQRMLTQINQLHPFDVGGLIHVTSRDMMAGYREFLSKRPWFHSWSAFENHRDPNIQKNAVFPHGAFWIGRCAFLREHGFPDREMIKKADDMLLGEMVVQVGGTLKSIDACSVQLNKGPRRGVGEEADDGWKGISVGPQNFNGLTIYPTGGMCNRLRNIITSIMLCRERKIPLRLLWERSSQTGMIDFKDYWTIPDDVVYQTLDTSEIMAVHNREIRHNAIYRQIPPDKLIGSYHNHWGLATLTGESIEKEGIQRLMDGLKADVVKLKEPWQSRVDEYCCKMEIPKMVGVHVRSFEFLFGERTPSNIKIITNNFIQRIADVLTDIFVATDSREIQQALGGCVWKVINGRDHLERHTKEDFEHGLMDFYILSRCSKVLGTKGSSYSHLAGLMAGNLEWVVGMRDAKEWDG